MLKKSNLKLTLPNFCYIPPHTLCGFKTIEIFMRQPELGKSCFLSIGKGALNSQHIKINFEVTYNIVIINQSSLSDMSNEIIVASLFSYNPHIQFLCLDTETEITLFFNLKKSQSPFCFVESFNNQKSLILYQKSVSRNRLCSKIPNIRLTFPMY